MDILDNVYGKVDKIRNLRLEENNERFYIMNEQQVFDLATQVINKIEKSKYRTIVFAESGSEPLIRICKQIAKRRNLEIDWFGFKIPRDIDINLYEFIKFYLSEEELNEENDLRTRDELLEEFCKKINIEEYLPRKEIQVDEVICNIGRDYKINSLDEILKGTHIHEVFSKEFLFFDEYILSGTIVRNFSFFSKLVCKKSKFKIGAYMIFSENIENLEKVEFSLYSKNNMTDAFRKGVYPYEDRVDIIGYFYNITKNEYAKIYLKDFIKECEDKNKELNDFINKIYEFIEAKKLLNLVKSKCKKEMLRDYFEEEDIIRYILKVFEQNIYSNKKEAIFLNEVFELYAPIWLPMPKEYHYQYWKALVRIQGYIDEYVISQKEEYRAIREYFLSELACKILQKVI